MWTPLYRDSFSKKSCEGVREEKGSIIHAMTFSVIRVVLRGFQLYKKWSN